MAQDASVISLCSAGGLCSSVGSCLPREAMQSQHSQGIGLSSWRVSFPQQDKQRPSSDRIWSAGQTVQFHRLGPRQSRQDGSHASQFGSLLLELWRRRVSVTFAHILSPKTAPWLTQQPCQTAAKALICYSFFHRANVKGRLNMNEKNWSFCHLWSSVEAYETLGFTDASHKRVAFITGLTGQSALIWKERDGYHTIENGIFKWKACQQAQQKYVMAWERGLW